jgi:hypothetical protein
MVQSKPDSSAVQCNKLQLLVFVVHGNKKVYHVCHHADAVTQCRRSTQIIYMPNIKATCVCVCM